MPTPALTDLQRIELAFPAAAMLHVLDHAADAAAPRVRQVRRLLVGTVDEALAGVTAGHGRKLRSRLDRVLRAFLSPLARVRGRVDVVGLIAWRVLEAILDAGVLVLPEGAPPVDRPRRDASGPAAGRGRSAGRDRRGSGVADDTPAPAGSGAVRGGREREMLAA